MPHLDGSLATGHLETKAGAILGRDLLIQMGTDFLWALSRGRINECKSKLSFATGGDRSGNTSSWMRLEIARKISKIATELGEELVRVRCLLSGGGLGLLSQRCRSVR
ncbi:hypothetical protein TNCT_59531 [Trichonephila clavata]|uniref:Uncharacterized protein n=1 Tax=Trichonephila clavata TaxID=2740835 RepID=A0A8X6GRV8_TRICU|nr:hypothetical protein TNCT_59531 [Trichonephila clavata]